MLEDGLYSLLVRVFWFTVTDTSAAHLSYFNVDPDLFANYPAAGVFDTSDTLTTAPLIVRLSAGQSIAVFVLQHSGVSWVIDGSGGTFFEMVKLGTATMSGRTTP